MCFFYLERLFWIINQVSPNPSVAALCGIFSKDRHCIRFWSFFFWKPKSSNLKIFRYDWQRQLYIVVFSLYLGFGVDFHDILPVFLPLALIRMWSAFYYDVLRISLGHQTTVLDQNRLLRMGPIFGDFVETADHKRAVGTVLESCSYCRRTNTVDVASTLGRTEKVFTIMIHAANLKFVFCTRIREEISWSWNSIFPFVQTCLYTSLCHSGKPNIWRGHRYVSL